MGTSDPLLIAIQEESRAKMKNRVGGPDRCSMCDRKGGVLPGCRASPMEIDVVAMTVARGRNVGASPMVTDQRVACALLMAFRGNFPPQ